MGVVILFFPFLVVCHVWINIMYYVLCTYNKIIINMRRHIIVCHYNIIILSSRHCPMSLRKIKIICNILLLYITFESTCENNIMHLLHYCGIAQIDYGLWYNVVGIILLLCLTNTRVKHNVLSSRLRKIFFLLVLYVYYT